MVVTALVAVFLTGAAVRATAQHAEPVLHSGRGLITSEGPTGLFINPTSGVGAAGAFSPQLCVWTQQVAGRGDVSNVNGLLTYTPLEWLEVGALLDDAVSDGHSPAFGPMLRLRLLADGGESPLPEVGVGYYAIEGRREIRERVAFAAASKTFAVSPAAFLRAIRLHGGVRGNWRDSTDDTEAVGYGGLELELPYGIHAIGELSTHEDPLPHTPFAFGLQVRHHSGVGFTASGVQTGSGEDLALYVGIGINFAR